MQRLTDIGRLCTPEFCSVGEVSLLQVPRTQRNQCCRKAHNNQVIPEIRSLTHFSSKCCSIGLIIEKHCPGFNRYLCLINPAWTDSPPSNTDALDLLTHFQSDIDAQLPSYPEELLLDTLPNQVDAANA